MIDRKLKIRAGLLIEQAQKSCFRHGIDPNGAPAVFVLAKDSDYRFFSIGHKGNLDADMERAIAEGFKMLGVIVLSFTDDGEPLIEDEMIEGADAKSVQAARQLFTEELISKGILKAGTATA